MDIIDRTENKRVIKLAFTEDEIIDILLRELEDKLGTTFNRKFIETSMIVDRGSISSICNDEPKYRFNVVHDLKKQLIEE